MKITYATEKIEKIFEDTEQLKRKTGQMARKIIQRLDALRASNTFGIFLATGLGRPERLTGDLEGYYSIRITDNYRLVVWVNMPQNGDVRDADQVMVKGVVDYHGRKNDWILP